MIKDQDHAVTLSSNHRIKEATGRERLRASEFRLSRAKVMHTRKLYLKDGEFAPRPGQ
ncbi:hypothetical protein ACPOL_0977 [Acidisarcina polymorpha]|uniref:Uncharacterized protein n=1 Tax=Acidisarcina polymorpha TaxID=2211140 RepID=A0A2Z5FU10_9BACT|nr:hypothetical protein ACPOL_0977 [Acidisarcina polymorpha]